MPKLIFNTEQNIGLLAAMSSRWSEQYEGITKTDEGYVTDESANSEGYFETSPRLIIYPWENRMWEGAVNEWFLNALSVVRCFDDIGIMPDNSQFRFEFYNCIYNDDYSIADKILVGEFSTENKGFIQGYNVEWDKYESTYFYDVRHFNRIDVVCVKAEPNKQGKFYDLTMRMLDSFDLEEPAKEINSFLNLKIREAINVLSDDLPINSLECEIISEEDLHLKKFTEFDVENNEQYFGRFYIVEFKKTGKSTYSISANSILGKLDNFTYDSWTIGGVLPEDTIFKATGKGIVLKNISDYQQYTGYLPTDTARYAICQIGWAQNLMIDESRKSYVEFVPVPRESKGLIDNVSEARIINNALVTTEQTYTQSRYKMIDYNHFKSYEEVEIGRIQGDFSQTTKYYWQNPPCQFIRTPSNIEIVEATHNYVAFKKIPVADTGGVIAYGTTTGYLNIRTSPVNGAIITSIPTGSRCNIYSISNGWAYLEYNGYKGYSSVQYMTIEYVETEATEAVFYGYQFEKTESEILIENRQSFNVPPNELLFDKYTLCAIDEEGKQKDIKSDLIQKIIESDGKINCTLVLNGERVGDLIDIETAFSGIYRGIIVSLEFNLGYQMIANATIQILNIGYGALMDVNKEFVYDKYGDLIFTQEDVS